jgi:hypothetical protein
MIVLAALKAPGDVRLTTGNHLLQAISRYGIDVGKANPAAV